MMTSTSSYYTIWLLTVMTKTFKYLTRALFYQEQLTFMDIVFCPRSFMLKVTADPAYDANEDKFLNQFAGLSVQPEEAARFHYHLYMRKVRPDRVLYVDVRPMCGWFHLVFVDRHVDDDYISPLTILYGF